ncbi:hypothetical protein E5357_16080 [Hominisplanchenecus murintestinalis]|uniref:Uncharacterized protein n=1 Tax=Hominisplanchenecus murintestinalis TaxID=2941517 RepID=A0AC61QVE4_9FIRM|nr:hypothetical protein [Hominisplanchenecus murintestinalis]TGX96443.1 hypothetical protein E5357_16080 [Hominisplanchenecus murintestinalis]
MSKEEQISFLAELLKLNRELVEKDCDVIDELGALYYSCPDKGGDSFFVDKDGSFLYADSSVGFTRHFEMFKEGKRTEIK